MIMIKISFYFMMFGGSAFKTGVAMCANIATYGEGVNHIEIVFISTNMDNMGVDPIFDKYAWDSRKGGVLEIR